MPRISAILPLSVLLGLVSASGCTPSKPPPSSAPKADMAQEKPLSAPAKVSPSPLWEQVKKLTGEQKYEAATKEVEKIRAAAEKAGNDQEWARALITMVQLRMALHGYETSVRYLMDQPWPKEPVAEMTLRLYYGQTLMRYLGSYSWEIRQREQVVQKGKVDLKKWTQEQIFGEAQRVYADVWAGRARLGDHPVGLLGEYINPGTYPKEVRGTLRDAVTYLYVQLLSNTRFWSAKHQNNSYTLPFKALLKGGDGADAAPGKLQDSRLHPLLKVCGLLDDLEAWHLRKARPGAALEARLERLRRLAGSFSEQDQKRTMREHLEAHLSDLKKHPWWAMGMARLVEMVRGEGDQVRARTLALGCYKAFPNAMGGRKCRHLAMAIEAPEFQLRSMLTDGLGKRSIQVTHKQLPAIHFRAYRRSLLDRIGTARDYNLFPNQREMRAIMASSRPELTWTTSLPATPDYKNHVTYVTPPIKKKGYYLIVGSVRKDFKESSNRILGVDFIASDLVLVTRRLPDGGLDVSVRSGATGRAVSGARVHLYRYDYSRGNKHHKVVTRRSSRDGTVRFRSNSERRHRSHFLVVEKGSDINLDTNSLRMYASRRANHVQRTLIYTDRSIYRPLQKLHFKAIAYKGKLDSGRFQTSPGTKLTISLMDPNYQKVKTLKLTTNSFGSASGVFEIPAGRVLGRWRVQSSISGQAYVRVEEYKRPTFEVKLKDPKGALRLNRKATLSGEARYYFGLPVTEGQVKWRVTRQAVYPWWWGYYWSSRRSSRAQLVAQGEARLEADGSFNFSFTPRADEKQDDKASRDLTYRYMVNADFTDEGGETRSASRGFRLGLFAVEGHISQGTGFFREGQAVKLTIRRTNLDGVARPGKGSWQLVALAQPGRTVPPADLPRPPVRGASFQTPGDKLRPRWSPGYSPSAVMAAWKDGPQQASGAVTHDKNGGATVTLPRLSPGAYRMRYETTDSFGATSKTWKDFVVAGKATPLALPAQLLVERSSVKVGGKARVLVHSGLRRQEMFLDIYRSGELVKRRRLTGSAVLELPIAEKDRGGFGLSLSVVRDHQFMNLTRSIYVPYDQKQLKLEFATFRDKLRPGQQETWRVTVKHAGGKKKGKLLTSGAAEVLAYMYDRSLDLFAPHSPPYPSSAYPGRTGSAWARSNLRVASTRYLRNNLVSLPGYSSPYPARLKFPSGYGIGGPGRRGGGYGYGRGVGLLRSSRSRAAGDEGGMPPPSPPKAAPRKMKKEAVAEQSVAARPEPSPVVSATTTAKSQKPAATQVRSNFSETAFFQPHLIVGQDGSTSIEFKVPDSVTSWNVWVHAITRDLSSGQIKKEARTVKDLMVRPYLPRFFREGDQAELKVVVNNASNKEMKGTLSLEVLDPESKKSVAGTFGLKATDRPFTVPAGGGANLTYKLSAPKKVGTVAFRVIARADSLSDGELRPVPVLPGRMHLAQSRFVSLRDKDRRTMTFADMRKDDDPSRVHDSLVVTIDGQLFYTVLKALPYLVNYPYQCTEQTMNRFVSTGILTSMYKDYPAVAAMAKKLSARKTRLETWDMADPNRKMTLEESPWLQQAKGGDAGGRELARVLDPRIAKAVRDAALAKLAKAQTGSGGFPWFPGGPPSPYITLYLMHGFAKALEFGVDVPKTMVRRGWAYLARHFRQNMVDWMITRDCCWEFLTFLNYVASSYPDPSWTAGALTKKERSKILDFTFKHWKQHSPYLKGYLALTLKRMGRLDDGKLVFASVMDSAKTKQDQGTFWAAEDRSWLWYNDTIETHAFALRTLIELDPKNAKKHGLVLWLLINKKLSHWKSTRATAEVVYSLVHYLKDVGALGVREVATVKAGPVKQEFVFEPDKYVGKSQLVIPGSQIKPKQSSTITVEKETKGFMFASATWHFSTERLPREARGDFLSVTRKYYKRELSGDKYVLKPLDQGASLKPGDQLEVQLSLRSKHAVEYVHLRDPRAAGLEPENAVSRHKWDLGISWYEETRDSGANFFFEKLPVGEYSFKYRLRANMAGKFKVGPATLQCLYAPEFVAYSAGHLVTVAPGK